MSKKENFLKHLKDTFGQTRLARGLTLLGLFCSSTGMEATVTLGERGVLLRCRGDNALALRDSRLISAAATRGLFTARNQKSHHSCSLFRAPRESPALGSAPKSAELTSQLPVPPLWSFYHLVLGPLPPKTMGGQTLEVLAVGSPWREGGQTRRWLLISKLFYIR